ncbi:unnamed protein product [Amoebophrya sp. A25]|nr:unnamed protein product [Amoebophrya sp. A25]|eukprot:GSA25T00023869001.1
MANAYIREPDTHGEVILHTTHGPLQIGLWSKEAPKACRNFVQNCLEGYYNQTIFHRIIKDYIVQGGDPLGTGNTCESIFGEPYPTEIHGRLQFRNRGMIAVANAGKHTKTNGSQFFFSLGSARELNGVHTIFGKVIGNSLYNLVKLSETDVDGKTDRPIEPPIITHVEVPNNPFDDIDIRPDVQQKNLQLAFSGEKQAAVVGQAEKPNRTKIAITKNKATIALGGESSSEDEDADSDGDDRKKTSSKAKGGSKVKVGGSPSSSSSEGEINVDKAARLNAKSSNKRNFKIKSAHELLQNDSRLIDQKAYDDNELEEIERKRQEALLAGGGSPSSSKKDLAGAPGGRKNRPKGLVGNGTAAGLGGDDDDGDDDELNDEDLLQHANGKSKKPLTAEQKAREEARKKKIEELKRGIHEASGAGQEAREKAKAERNELSAQLLQGFTKGIKRKANIVSAVDTLFNFEERLKKKKEEQEKKRMAKKKLEVPRRDKEEGDKHKNKEEEEEDARRKEQDDEDLSSSSSEGGIGFQPKKKKNKPATTTTKDKKLSGDDHADEEDDDDSFALTGGLKFDHGD